LLGNDSINDQGMLGGISGPRTPPAVMAAEQIVCRILTFQPVERPPCPQKVKHSVLLPMAAPMIASAIIALMTTPPGRRENQLLAARKTFVAIPALFIMLPKI